MATRAQWRPAIFCDFDGTITQLDVTDVILSQLAHPSWREVEQAWVQGLIGSHECLERQMALVETSERELNALIDSIPIDPCFGPFFRSVRRRRLPFFLLSDGFDYVIRRVLRRAGVNGQLRNGSDLFASSFGIERGRLVTSFPHAGPACAHGCATCKAAIVERLGAGRAPIIYIGDGLSDRFAAEKSDLVFAKRQLAAYCEEHGISWRPFETFEDIQHAIEPLVAPSMARRRRAVLTAV